MPTRYGEHIFAARGGKARARLIAGVSTKLASIRDLYEYGYSIVL
jgi:hypothetical protein